MKQNKNSVQNKIKYYIRDVKIAGLLGIITAFLICVALVAGGYTPSAEEWFVLVFGFPVLMFFGLLAAIALQSTFPHAIQFAKFSIIGGLSGLINLSVLNVLLAVTGITSGHLFSAFVAGTFFLSSINGYFFNKNWAFKTRTNKIHVEFEKFVLIGVGGLIINVAVATFVVNIIGAPKGVSATFWANTGAVTALLVAMAWNFFGYKHFVFKED